MFIVEYENETYNISDGIELYGKYDNYEKASNNMIEFVDISKKIKRNGTIRKIRLFQVNNDSKILLINKEIILY